MSVEMTVKDGVYQLSIPAEDMLEDKMYRDLIDYVRGRKIIAESQATEEQVAELADDLIGGWWGRNKESFLNGSGD